MEKSRFSTALDTFLCEHTNMLHSSSRVFSLCSFPALSPFPPSVSPLSLPSNISLSPPVFRFEGSVYEVMWVDFEMDNFITLQASQAVRWRIEYPSTGETAEAITVVYVSQRDVLGIVPLAEVRGASLLFSVFTSAT